MVYWNTCVMCHLTKSRLTIKLDKNIEQIIYLISVASQQKSLSDVIQGSQDKQNHFFLHM